MFSTVPVSLLPTLLLLLPVLLLIAKVACSSDGYWSKSRLLVQVKVACRSSYSQLLLIPRPWSHYSQFRYYYSIPALSIISSLLQLLPFLLPPLLLVSTIAAVLANVPLFLDIPYRCSGKTICYVLACQDTGNFHRQTSKKIGRAVS
jgi:hypothetical protein